MNVTTIQKLINQIESELKKVSLGGIKYYGLMKALQMAEELKAEARTEIVNAYNSAKNYPDPNCDGDKYYFMTYITND